MTVHMIWAEARDRVIGAGGGIPWQLPGEQAMFKQRTMGATVVMGRATWDSLPERVRPLPGRRNVVLTRDPQWTAPGADVAHAVHAVDLSGEVWVMGGAAVYEAFLPVATHILRTRIDLEVAGDTRAPALGDSWVVTSESGWQTASNGLRYVVEDVERAV
ncbi:dihydrofolate reductase [Actinoplanes sp. NPDC026619]|uniref:dihydrofolate reductase n=1 Tax=Actinoplanes sp. NPDC026619 TaxID=3155798 RepID=UPI0033DCB1E5